MLNNSYLDVLLASSHWFIWVRVTSTRGDSCSSHVITGAVVRRLAVRCHSQDEKNNKPPTIITLNVPSANENQRRRENVKTNVMQYRNGRYLGLKHQHAASLCRLERKEWDIYNTGPLPHLRKGKLTHTHTHDLPLACSAACSPVRSRSRAARKSWSRGPPRPLQPVGNATKAIRTQNVWGQPLTPQRSLLCGERNISLQQMWQISATWPLEPRSHWISEESWFIKYWDMCLSRIRCIDVCPSRHAKRNCST